MRSHRFADEQGLEARRLLDLLRSSTPTGDRFTSCSSSRHFDDEDRDESTIDEVWRFHREGSRAMIRTSLESLGLVVTEQGRRSIEGGLYVDRVRAIEDRC